MTLADFGNFLTVYHFSQFLKKSQTKKLPRTEEIVTDSLSIALQMTYVDAIAEKLVCSTDDRTRMYGCMVVMALLHRQPDTCISVLLR